VIAMVLDVMIDTIMVRRLAIVRLSSFLVALGLLRVLWKRISARVLSWVFRWVFASSASEFSSRLWS